MQFHHQHRRYLLAIIFFCLSSLQNPLLASFPHGTKILTPHGLVAVEALNFETPITGYDPKTNTFPDVKIKQFKVSTSCVVMVIRTDRGTIICDPEQLFYEQMSAHRDALSRKKADSNIIELQVNDACFVMAQDLQVGDILINKDFEPCMCLRISAVLQGGPAYGIVLDAPHLFFSSDVQVLTHNFGEGNGLGLSLTGCHAEAYFSAFSAIPSMAYSSRGYHPQAPLMAHGISEAMPNISRQLSGAFWLKETRIVAALGEAGIILLIVEALLGRKTVETEIEWSWVKLGIQEKVGLENPAAQEQIKAMDAEHLQVLDQFVQSMPQRLQRTLAESYGAVLNKDIDINTRYSSCALRFGDYDFMPLAAHSMHELGITPSKVLDTIANGESRSSNFWTYNNITSKKNDVSVLCKNGYFRSNEVAAVSAAGYPLEIDTSNTKNFEIFKGNARHLIQERQTLRAAQTIKLETKTTSITVPIETKAAAALKEDTNKQLEATDTKEESTTLSGGGNSPEDPKKPDDNNRPKDPNEAIKIDEKNAKHIFRKSDGHFSDDSPLNRKLLEGLVNDKKNYCGPDKHGNSIYGKTLSNGKQLWAHLRNGKITHGGINESPIPYNPITEFSAQTKILQKIH